MKNRLLIFAAVGEAGLGLVLLVYPPIVVQLLCGAEIADAGLVMSRVAGIALIALGAACWPGGTALGGMLTWSVLATTYMTWLAIRGEWVGPLLWPAVLVHVVLTLLLGRAWLARPSEGSG